MGASASASTGWFAVTTDSDSASNTWRFTTPTAGATITWNYGPNKVNGTLYPRNGPPPPFPLTEMKFFNPGATPGAAPVGPVAKVFTGFTKTVGNAGSSATSSGLGSATSGAGALFGTNWVASWTVTAAGVARVAPPPAGTYEAKADAHDPLPLTRAGLTDLGIVGGRISLYLPVGLTEMSHLPRGSGGFSVEFRTSAGAVNLLSLQSSGQGVTARGDNPDYLKIYRLQALTDHPMALGYAPLRLEDAEHALATLMKTGSLRAPLLFGFLLENIPMPSQEIGPGVLAEFYVSTRVADAAAGASRRPQRRKKA